MPVLSNPRHERFAQEIAKGASAGEAYRLAGYDADAKSAETAGPRLFRNVQVQARVAELQQRGAARAEVTIETILDELKEARELALKCEQASAAVAASMGRAKVAGLIVDKSVVNVNAVYEGMTDEELLDEAERLAEMTDALLDGSETQH